jgi:hypothetical protein
MIRYKTDEKMLNIDFIVNVPVFLYGSRTKNATPE